jgi:hypothetical protein
VHDIIGDIIEWDAAHESYVAAGGRTGERYTQRIEAAERMAAIEARWDHLPGGFGGQRNLIRAHVSAVAEAAVSAEELCWLAIAAASAWLPGPAREPLIAGVNPLSIRPS